MCGSECTDRGGEARLAMANSALLTAARALKTSESASSPLLLPPAPAAAAPGCALAGPCLLPVLPNGAPAAAGAACPEETLWWLLPCCTSASSRAGCASGNLNQSRRCGSAVSAIPLSCLVPTAAALPAPAPMAPPTAPMPSTRALPSRSARKSNPVRLLPSALSKASAACCGSCTPSSTSESLNMGDSCALISTLARSILSLSRCSSAWSAAARLLPSAAASLGVRAAGAGAGALAIAGGRVEGRCGTAAAGAAGGGLAACKDARAEAKLRGCSRSCGWATLPLPAREAKAAAAGVAPGRRLLLLPARMSSSSR